MVGAIESGLMRYGLCDQLDESSTFEDSSVADVAALTLEIERRSDSLVALTEVQKRLETHSLAPSLKAHLSLLEGIVTNRLGRSADAIAALRRCLKLAEENSITHLQVDAERELGVVLRWTGLTTPARDRMFACLRIATSAGDKIGIALCWAELGRMMLEEGLAHTARDYLLEASSRIPLKTRLREAVRISVDLATASLQMSTNEELPALVESMNSVSSELRLDNYLRFAAALNAAELYSNQGCFEESLLQILQAGELHDQHDSWQVDRLALVSAWNSRALSPLSSAQKLFELSKIFADRKLSSHSIDALRKAVICFYDAGETESAADALVQATRQARKKSWHRVVEDLETLRKKLRLPRRLARSSAVELVDDTDNVAETGYIKLGHLGSGSFGEVWLAYDIEASREVAIKQLKLPVGIIGKERARLLDSLERELDATLSIDHPSVVKVMSIGEFPNNTPYLVMPHINGMVFRKYMAKTVDPDEFLAMVLEIYEALRAGHRMNVVHADVKPENIMVQVDGKPVLLDYGIARVLTSQTYRQKEASGTPQYMSPEQQLGHKADGAADLFSLGIVVAEWIMGQRPFEPAPPTNRILFWWYRRKLLRQIRSSSYCTPALAKLVSQFLSYSPKARILRQQPSQFAPSH